MKRFFSLINLMFIFWPILNWTWAHDALEDTIRQAERLFSEKNYQDALFQYSQALTMNPLDETLKTDLIFRLATCHLKTDTPKRAFELLNPLHADDDHFFYLMGITHRKLKEPFQALHFLQQMKTHSPSSLLEQSTLLTQLGSYQAAQRLLSTIHWQQNAPEPFYLAQLQLIKIELLNKNWKAAQQKMKVLFNHLPPRHLLHAELIYLDGCAKLSQGQPTEAGLCFEKLRSSHKQCKKQVLHALVVSDLEQALLPQTNENLISLFAKAQNHLEELLNISPEESSGLLLTEFYLIKAKKLGDINAYKAAEKLLEKNQYLDSSENLRIRLKKAAAGINYATRQKEYNALLSENKYPKDFQAKVRFYRGINEFEEKNYAASAKDFNRAAEEMLPFDLEQTATALMYEALSYAHHAEKTPLKQALAITDQLLTDPIFYAVLKYPEEICFLSAWAALKLDEKEALQRSLLHLKNRSPTALKFAGLICLRLKNWPEADIYFKQLLAETQDAPLQCEAWFWRGYCADRQHQKAEKQHCLQQAYATDGECEFAPIAYFTLFTPRDYLSGQRKPIKHLQLMPQKFPLNPLSILAHLLNGLYYKKNHFSEEGKLMQPKDWSMAIDAFHSAETLFDVLKKKQQIPLSEMTYYQDVRDRAQLERGAANFEIAKSSQGAKKQIYLEYAKDVLQDLVTQFKGNYTSIWAETELTLARIHAEKNAFEEAINGLNLCLEHYEQAQIRHGSGLMSVWYEKGKLAYGRQDYSRALISYENAEKACTGLSSLNPNIKLDLWIQQSLCYKSLNRLDEAMTLLSRVINEEAISPLRIEAMFLRAQIYELQNRPELAIKQLEAIILKGGDWAEKAQKKLEDMHGI